MHRYLRRGGRLALFLAALLALYTLLLLAAYSFPDEWIRENVTAATNVLIEEGNMPGGYATYFWHSGFGIADNVTDRVIYEGLLKMAETLWTQPCARITRVTGMVMPCC